ncbi:hypothetical protein FACS1894184_09480 [Clostridia bacterium]|nr:hypothetical protein FACS1894184_09480 [Clostridia bacterium]
MNPNNSQWAFTQGNVNTLPFSTGEIDQPAAAAFDSHIGGCLAQSGFSSAPNSGANRFGGAAFTQSTQQPFNWQPTSWQPLSIQPVAPRAVVPITATPFSDAKRATTAIAYPVADAAPFAAQAAAVQQAFEPAIAAVTDIQTTDELSDDHGSWMWVQSNKGQSVDTDPQGPISEIGASDAAGIQDNQGINVIQGPIGPRGEPGVNNYHDQNQEYAYHRPGNCGNVGPCDPIVRPDRPAGKCCCDCDKWIQRDPDDEWENCNREGGGDCCPDYCPVFGIAAALCQPIKTIATDGPAPGPANTIKFAGSYGFNIPMNYRKTEFRVKKSGLYVIAYYVDANLDDPGAVRIKVDITRCSPANQGKDEPEENSDWHDTSGNAFHFCNELQDAGTTNVHWAFGIDTVFLNKGDSVGLSLVGNDVTRVRFAALGAFRLMPCNCIPPGGLPRFEIGPLFLSSGKEGTIVNRSPLQSMLTNVLTGPLSGVVSAALPTLLKDSLPSILEGYLTQDVGETEAYDCQQ